MKVTDIKPQQKRTDRVSIFVNGKYSFSLNKTQLQSTGLKVGEELSLEQIDRYKKISEDGKLFDRVLNWLARRPRSEWEIFSYLERKGSSPDLAQEIVYKLRSYRYVDDVSFAESWVRNRRQLKHTSKRKLRQELLKKNVSREIIEHVLEADETTDEQTLVELVAKKQRQSRYRDKEKLMAYLARQGFSYEDIKRVLSE